MLSNWHEATDPWTRKYWDYDEPVVIRHGSSHSVEGLGETKPRPIGFRFPAATRRDEMREIQEVYA